MPVIQPYFKPYTGKLSSPFMAAWQSFVGTRSKMNMLAIEQQMKLMDPSLINDQILRAQKNIHELQQLKVRLQADSNKAKSQFLSKATKSTLGVTKDDLRLQEKLGKAVVSSSSDLREAKKTQAVIDAYNNPIYRQDIIDRIDKISQAWSAQRKAKTLLDEVAEDIKITPSDANRAILAGLLADELKNRTPNKQNLDVLGVLEQRSRLSTNELPRLL